MFDDFLALRGRKSGVKPPHSKMRYFRGASVTGAVARAVLYYHQYSTASRA